MNFIKLTSAQSEKILLVNMDHIVSVQEEKVGLIRGRVEERTICRLLKKDTSSSFEVMESMQEIEQLLKAHHGR